MVLMKGCDQIRDNLTELPGEDMAYLTEKRIGIQAWFVRNAPSLGELYEGSLKMVYGPIFPECELGGRVNLGDVHWIIGLLRREGPS